MKITVLIISAGVLFCSCQKNKANVATTDVPVIEGYLQTGDRLHLKVSHQVPFNTGTVYGEHSLDTLKVMINNNAISTCLTFLDTGTYYDSSIAIKDGMRFTLTCQYGEKMIVAETIIPGKPVGFTASVSTVSITKITQGSFPSGGFTEPSPIELTWSNPDGSYYIVVIENIEKNPEAIFDTAGQGSPPSNVFRNQPTKKTGFSINTRQFQYFGLHRMLLYHINSDYAALYGDKSSSSQNLTTPTTSIVNAVGIFTGMSADTLYLKVNKK